MYRTTKIISRRTEHNDTRAVLLGSAYLVHPQFNVLVRLVTMIRCSSLYCTHCIQQQQYSNSRKTHPSKRRHHPHGETAMASFSVSRVGGKVIEKCLWASGACPLDFGPSIVDCCARISILHFTGYRRAGGGRYQVLSSSPTEVKAREARAMSSYRYGPSQSTHHSLI